VRLPVIAQVMKVFCGLLAIADAFRR